MLFPEQQNISWKWSTYDSIFYLFISEPHVWIWLQKWDRFDGLRSYFLVLRFIWVPRFQMWHNYVEILPLPKVKTQVVSPYFTLWNLRV